MEAKHLTELIVEDEESLDIRVFNPPSYIIPQELPAPPSPTNSSASSASSISLSPTRENKPNSKTGWQFPPPTNTLKDPRTKTSQPNPSDPGTKATPHVPNKHADSYELDKFKENRMIIFNHDHFMHKSPRPGTDEDETALRETFQKFRFTIDPTHDNLKMDALMKTVKTFARKTDFSEYGCICVAILTHGYKEPGFLRAYDGLYSEHEIFKYFDVKKNLTLAGKPIIFIIQACRGKKTSKKVKIGNKKSPLQKDIGEEHYHIPMEADRLVFHSSFPGKAAVRDPDYGSWFIQALCRKINECALTHELESIFRLVRRDVALHEDKRKPYWKQMPVVTSTTLRDIRLAPNPQDEKKPPGPATTSVVQSEMDDTNENPPSDHQLTEILEEHVRLGASSNSLLHEKEQPRPVAHSALQSEVDDSKVSHQLAEKLEKLVCLNVPSSTLQDELEQPPTASPFVFQCKVDDFKVYPSSHQVAEKLNELLCLLTPSDTNSILDADVASPMEMKLHHLPCCCFVEYFDYLKNCLETFSRYNLEDDVAKSLLKMAEKTEPGQEYNLQRFTNIQSMWEYLESNKHRFPPREGFKFLHRMYIPDVTPNVSTKEDERPRLEPL